MGTRLIVLSSLTPEYATVTETSHARKYSFRPVSETLLASQILWRMNISYNQPQIPFVQAHGSLQSLSLEQDAPTPTHEYSLYDQRCNIWPASLPLQCPSQAHAALGVFEVALVVVFIVVDGGLLGEPPLSEHSEDASPAR